MKTLIVLITVLFTAAAGFSQQQNPVTWQAEYKSVSATEGEIVIHARIDKGWHTYSQRPTDDGPIPTSFTFTPSPKYELDGKTKESDAHDEFVKAFDATIFVFTDKAEFRQKIRLKDKPGFTIPFKLEFMSCNDLMCLPPKTVDLTVKVH